MEKKNHQMKTLWMLFSSMLYISAFTFGGGFVIVSLMKKRFVDGLNLISEEEMLDYTALAQSCPGPIAVNAAILVGWRAAGVWGMLAAVLGTVIPPMVILSVVSVFYNAFASNPYVALVLQGMQAGVAAVIADVVCSMGGKIIGKRNPVQLAVMAAAFIAVYVFKVNVIVVILTAGVVGAAVQLAGRRRA